MKEIWKDIEGFENYRISNTGRIISKSFVNTYRRRKKDGTYSTISRTLKEKELKPWLSCGYPSVQLANGDKKRKVCVHVLVAESFLSKSEGDQCVNHIDGNKANNNADNLEWCTYSENNQHAYDNGLTHAPHLSSERAKAMRAKANMSCHYRKVKDITTGKEYKSISSTRQDGFVPRNVQKVCAGNAKTHQGHVFAYM